MAGPGAGVAADQDVSFQAGETGSSMIMIREIVFLFADQHQQRARFGQSAQGWRTVGGSDEAFT